MKTINIPRMVARSWQHPVNRDTSAWISIGEPDKGFEHVQNPILDKIPKLKINFYDLVEDVIESSKVVYRAPTISDAHKIVRFIMDNQGKRMIVNCAAGVSRSGAVCKFLEDKMGYKWSEYGKKNSSPNRLLYELLVEAWEQRKKKYGI